MTRIIRLTESDLTRIVKRVIKEQESTSNEYVNDPDLKKIQSDITMLNGMISNFKSPFNVKSYWLNGGKRGNVSVVQLLESKKDTNGYKRTIFEIHLGQTKKPFSSGSQFSDASNNKVDTSKAQTLMTTIVNDIAKFSGKFPLDSNIKVWAANTIIIERNPKTN
jgi:hypothetical protein